MSLVFSTTYPSPTNSVAPSAAYPQGSAKNVTTGAGVDGTPLERQWVDDFLGFVQRLNLEASTTPSGISRRSDEPHLNITSASLTRF